MWKYLAVCALVLWTPSVQAAPSPSRLTDKGRLMLGGSVGGYWSNNDDSPGLYRYDNHAVWVEPSVAYFAWDRVGIGMYGGYSYGKSMFNSGFASRDHLLSVGIIGISELALAPRLGLLFSVRLGFGERWRSFEATNTSFFTSGAAGAQTQQRLPYRPSNSVYDHRLRAGLLLPFVFHASDSVALGLGPSFEWEFFFDRDDTERAMWNQFQVGAASWIGCSF